MSESLNRRNFLKKSVIASTGAALGLSLEKKAFSAETSKKPGMKLPKLSSKGMPMGKINNIKVSRLICGGNLIEGYPHSRDLAYVRGLLKAYNTVEKVIETFELAEEKGINTLISNHGAIPILAKYWNERGGTIQWIAEGHPLPNDIKTHIQKSIDNGATMVYVQGGKADYYVQKDRVDIIGKSVDFIRRNGLPAGIGAHSLKTIKTCVEAGLAPDFFVKTLHHSNYWSAKRPGQDKSVIENPADNYWSVTPEETIEYMRTIEKPWIAFKVMAAGAIHPSEAFPYAYNSGADFICAGMFDFQILEDVLIAKDATAKADRVRPWRA